MTSFQRRLTKNLVILRTRDRGAKFQNGLERPGANTHMQLVWPAEQYLASYTEALRRGWSPDNLRPEASTEELAEFERDPVAFVAEHIDREAKGPPLTLPDGSVVPRLPGYHLWMWD